LEEGMENNEEREKKVEFPARYDYDSIDIHDGSWLSPIEYFFIPLSLFSVASSLRAISGPEGIWGRENGGRDARM
jgi:hypothetical protein